MGRTVITKNIWKNAFKTGGQIKDTDLKNGMQSKLFFSPINTSGRATIAHAITHAIVRLAKGDCSVATTSASIYVECTEGPTTVSLFYNKGHKRLYGYIDPAGTNRSLIGDSYVHWSIFVPRIVEMYLEDTTLDFRNNFQKIVNTYATAVPNVLPKKEFFILNDYLYESRNFYIEDDRGLEVAQTPYDCSALTFSDITSSLSNAIAGDFKFIDLSAKPPSPDVTKNETEEPHKPWSFYSLPSVKRLLKSEKLIPAFDLSLMKIQPSILSLAEMVKNELESAVPVNNILLYGEAGAGKSTAAKILAQLWGIPYRFANFSLNSEESELIGTYRPKADGTFEFFEPAFIETYREGGVIELMEINYARPGALGVLNSALDDTAQIVIGNGELVSRHPQCIIIATTNVAYAGCQQMNAALKDRFQELLKVDKMSSADLVDITIQLSGNTNKTLIAKMVDAVQKISIKAHEEQIIGGVCSTRQLINWARKTKYTKDPIAAARATILAGVSFDDEVIEDIIDTILRPLF